MQYQHFQDFDAFAATVRDIDSTMMLQNPKRRKPLTRHKI